MAINLIDEVSRQLTPELIGKIGNAVGETPTTITRAAPFAIPSILRGVVRRGSTEPGARDLIDSIRAGGWDESTISSLESMLGHADTRRILVDRGHGILSSLFGRDLDRATSELSNATAIPLRASRSILAMLAPVVMTVVGNHVRENNLSPAGLSTLLQGQSNYLALSPAYVPHGAREVAISRGRHAQSKGWIWGVLGVAALALGGGIFLCNRKTEMSSAELPGVPNLEEKAPPEAPSTAPRQIGGGPLSQPEPAPGAEPPAKQQAPSVENPMVKTPDTTAPEMKAPEGKKESPKKMEAPKMETPKTHTSKTETSQNMASEGTSERPVPERFYMKGLRYDIGTTNLTNDDGTLDRVAKTLERNPNRHVLIEGFADDTGSVETNQKLSIERAESAKKALVEKGADPARIETAGFASTHPIANNATPAGRSVNRRVEFVVTGR